MLAEGQSWTEYAATIATATATATPIPDGTISTLRVAVHAPLPSLPLEVPLQPPARGEAGHFTVAPAPAHRAKPTAFVWTLRAAQLPSFAAVFRSFHALHSYPHDPHHPDGRSPLDDLGSAAHRVNCFELPNKALYSRCEAEQKQGQPMGPCYRVAGVSSAWVFSGAKYTLRPPRDDLFLPLKAALRAVFGDEFIDLRGFFYYPPSGFREWHTNRFDCIGWRVYLTSVCVVDGGGGGGSESGCHAENEAGAFMNFVDPRSGDLVRSDDLSNSTGIRIFKLSHAPLLWHCVFTGARTHRWSCGIQISDYGAWRLLSHAGLCELELEEFLLAYN